MPSTIPFDPHRFETAAAYYVHGRPPYAAQLIDRVAARLELESGHRLLDLGTGSGEVAIAFARLVGEVVAMDPEPAMLRLAEQRAADAGVRVQLVEGNSYGLDASLGRFRLVTIGRAFHWMDRAKTLEALDGLIEQGGTVALFSTRRIPAPETAWSIEYDHLVDQYRTADATRQIRNSPEWAPHESILLHSVFSRVDRIGIVEHRSTPLEHLVARALSYSGNSPSQLGERARTLQQAVRAHLESLPGNKLFPEIIESEALLASR
jgi:SAM-dependent methyltransferase